ncbi:MAG: DUF2062 domain-containing protein [Planctomycetota bacterium]
MFILAWIRRLYKVLSADASPSAIAFATSFGIMAGMMPLTSGMAIAMLLLILVFRVQVSAAIGMYVVGLLIRAATLPMLVDLGQSFHTEGNREFFTWFLNLPVIAWLDLHVYAVLGGLVGGFIAGALSFAPMYYSVKAYRKWAHEKVSKNKFFRWLTGFWLTKVLRFVFVG